MAGCKYVSGLWSGAFAAMAGTAGGALLARVSQKPPAHKHVKAAQTPQTGWLRQKIPEDNNQGIGEYRFHEASGRPTLYILRYDFWEHGNTGPPIPDVIHPDPKEIAARCIVETVARHPISSATTDITTKPSATAS